MYRLRWKRRELLWRAIRAGSQLSPVKDLTAKIAHGDILVFATIRNEVTRLPEFLDHYRKLGVSHFLIVDNGSDDGTAEMLRGAPDVSLWRAGASYRRSRFGMDWICALLMRHGHGHWCLTVDADELLIYPEYESRNLQALTAELDGMGVEALGALMLDLYPRGPLGQADAADGAAVTDRLSWFDSGPYRRTVVYPKRNRIVRGGPRERIFFRDSTELSPTLNKLPLVRWHWRYIYVNSTHSMLPPRLNDLYDGPGDPRLSGALLHSKFLPEILSKATEELDRQQHFVDPKRYNGYHQAIKDAPVLWNESSVRFEGWRQLVDLGLIGVGENSADGNAIDLHRPK